MSKDSRQGGKYTGNHTTLSHAAALVCDVVHECEYVRVISPGVLKSGLRPAQGKRRVKIIEDNSRLLLKGGTTFLCKKFMSTLQTRKKLWK